MMRSNESNELGRQVGLAAGALMIAIGIWFGAWLVQTADVLLRHPDEVPLIETILAHDSGRMGIGGNPDDGVEVSFSTNVLPIVVVGFLVFALGSVAAAVITGGVRLLGGALGILPAAVGKDKKDE